MMPPTSAGDALARQEKVDVCHRSDDSDAYYLTQIAAPALDAHLAHGDGQVGDAVPDQEDAVFDEACQPEATIVAPLAACYTDNEDNSVNVLIDLQTGAITATESCPYFGGNCAADGTASPADDLGGITGFAYNEINTAADPDGGGCDAGGPDRVENTFTRSDGDSFAGEAVAFCDGEALGAFNFTATLTDGACPVQDGAETAFSRGVLTKSAWLEDLR